jgi:hypothetical protein
MTHIMMMQSDIEYEIPANMYYTYCGKIVNERRIDNKNPTCEDCMQMEREWENE